MCRIIYDSFTLKVKEIKSDILTAQKGQAINRKEVESCEENESHRSGRDSN